jgi:hypothetical protein
MTTLTAIARRPDVSLSTEHARTAIRRQRGKSLFVTPAPAPAHRAACARNTLNAA